MTRRDAVSLLLATTVARAEDRPPSGDGGKPAAPASPAAEKKPLLEELGNNKAKLGAITFDKVTREIELPCQVNITNEILEYLLVHETGKLHESLFTTTATGLDLNIVLLLLNYQPSPQWFAGPGQRLPLAEVPAAGQLETWLRWSPAEGQTATVRAESWVRNRATNAPAIDSPWVFNGGQNLGEGAFTPQTDGSLIALYLDPRSLINSPRPGADDDELWLPRKDLPKKGTPVTLLLRPLKKP